MEIANHEYYVSLEVAKLLKEAGFDWECPYKYERSIMVCRYEDYEKPTLEVVQRWLREVKNLIILIDIIPSYCNKKPMGYKFVIHVSCGNHIYGEWKDTYEEAQQAGIKKALELILEKRE